ncbi:hypothetical protein H6763_04110 [Candidatus Nomurabacteria bacterium]|uniref:Uncharacterized protein n=1 Tax=Candidatus Dojkabacteria bacterium TaxID=2099670 RepID=A0A955I3A6_9BACT|nr:hypothetical protein [Candidatus Dojkabacteria bacterium]MCB9789579.1 hypothetical protein [Candidatus Nomurabacteria bacterium]MCB9803984.1 hypothetical protein [Candidatus Nomurabacteria bacterium]
MPHSPQENVVLSSVTTHENPDTGLVSVRECVATAALMSELTGGYAEQGYLCFPLNMVDPNGTFIPGPFFAIPLERLPGGPCYSPNGSFPDIAPGLNKPTPGIHKARELKELRDLMRSLEQELRSRYLLHDERIWGNLHRGGLGSEQERKLRVARKKLACLLAEREIHPTAVSFPTHVDGELTPLEIIRLGIVTRVYQKFGYIASKEIDERSKLAIDHYTHAGLQTPLLFGRFDDERSPDNPLGFNPTATLRLIYPGSHNLTMDAISSGASEQAEPFKHLYPGMVPAYAHVESSRIRQYLSIPTFGEASQAATNRSKGRMLGQMVNMLQTVFGFLNSKEADEIFDNLPSASISGNEGPALAMAIAGQKDVARGVESFFSRSGGPKSVARQLGLFAMYPRLNVTCLIGKPSFELRGAETAETDMYGGVYPVQIIIQRRR